MWATECERAADTITWFPHHVTLPITSSINLVIAGAYDIVHALKHPLPGSPLAPLSDSEVAALTTITKVLLRCDPDSPAAPLLRVPAVLLPPMPMIITTINPIEAPVLGPVALKAPTPVVVSTLPPITRHAPLLLL
jgi:hypothetical protein